MIQSNARSDCLSCEARFPYYRSATASCISFSIFPLHQLDSYMQIFQPLLNPLFYLRRGIFSAMQLPLWEMLFWVWYLSYSFCRRLLSYWFLGFYLDNWITLEQKLTGAQLRLREKELREIPYSEYVFVCLAFVESIIFFQEKSFIRGKKCL